MRNLAIILEFACNKHKGQKDKGGQPYIFHCVEVALGVQSESAKVVAYLHDILEDVGADDTEFIAIGVSEEELKAIHLLTKPKDEPYMEYIKRVAENPLAREVKMSDLRHNMKIERIPNPTEKDYARIEKYKKAYEYLEGAK